MKRSEAIDIMLDVVHRNLGKRVDDQDVVNQMLDELIEAGVELPSEPKLSKASENIVNRNKLIDELRDEGKQPSFKGVF